MGSAPLDFALQKAKAAILDRGSGLKLDQN